MSAEAVGLRTEREREQRDEWVAHVERLLGQGYSTAAVAASLSWTLGKLESFLRDMGRTDLWGSLLVGDEMAAMVLPVTRALGASDLPVPRDFDPNLAFALNKVWAATEGRS